MRIVIYTICGLLIVWAILRMTKTLQFYVLPSDSNEPTLQEGAYLFATNLREPERKDFICFDYQSPEHGPQLFMKRLCGMPGDTVEIKKGVLFVNGKNADEGLNLKFTYKVPAVRLRDIDLKEGDRLFSEGSEDSVLVRLDKESAKKVGGVMQISDDDVNLFDDYDPDWSVDFFGPYVVPEKHYFVMGDSRHNSMDSRFIGPIPVENVTGVILGK